MKMVFIVFIVAGFFFGFAATKSKVKIPIPTELEAETKKPTGKAENFEFLYGQWELLTAQGVNSRMPASLDETNLNFVLDENLYLDSDATNAKTDCSGGVSFKKYTKGEHRSFVKSARTLPLLREYFADGKREGIWTGEVLCKVNQKVLWSAALLTRRQLFLSSDTHVVELYRRDSIAPVHDSFTDSDSEVTTE